MWHYKNEGEKSGEEGGMIKWLGENGGELVGTNKYLVCKKLDLCVEIRFFCRLHRGCSSRGSRMLCYFMMILQDRATFVQWPCTFELFV
jgi:hypothetical protein